LPVESSFEIRWWSRREFGRRSIPVAKISSTRSSTKKPAAITGHGLISSTLDRPVICPPLQAFYTQIKKANGRRNPGTGSDHLIC
jgi:hypothetical protein